MLYKLTRSSERWFDPLMARHLKGRNPEWLRVGWVRPWWKSIGPAKDFFAIFDREAAVVAPAWEERTLALRPGEPVIEFGALIGGSVERVAAVSIGPSVRWASELAAQGKLVSKRKHAIMGACPRTCHRCGGGSTYSSFEQNEDRFGYDAVFCERCDIWLERGCTDPACCYCSIRPARPSLVPYPRDDR